MSDLAQRAAKAAAKWEATLSDADRKSIPIASIERPRPDEGIIILRNSAPQCDAYRAGAKLSDTMSEYTLRSALPWLAGPVVHDHESAWEAYGATIHDFGVVAARKEINRKRTRSRHKRGDQLLDLSALVAAYPPQNQWAPELAIDCLSWRLADTPGALPQPAGPPYVTPTIVSWAARVVSVGGGGKARKLSPRGLADVLLDPAELLARLDDQHARRELEKLCPPLWMRVSEMAPLSFGPKNANSKLRNVERHHGNAQN